MQISSRRAKGYIQVSEAAEQKKGEYIHGGDDVDCRSCRVVSKTSQKSIKDAGGAVFPHTFSLENQMFLRVPINTFPLALGEQAFSAKPVIAQRAVSPSRILKRGEKRAPGREKSAEWRRVAPKPEVDENKPKRANNSVENVSKCLLV